MTRSYTIYPKSVVHLPAKKFTYAPWLLGMILMLTTTLSCVIEIDQQANSHQPLSTKETVFSVGTNTPTMKAQEAIYPHGSPKKVKVVTYSQSSVETKREVENHCHDQEQDSCSLFLVMTPSIWNKEYSSTAQSSYQSHNHAPHASYNQEHSDHSDLPHHHDSTTPPNTLETMPMDLLIQPPLEDLHSNTPPQTLSKNIKSISPREYYEEVITYSSTAKDDTSSDIDDLSSQTFINHTAEPKQEFKTRAFAKQKTMVAQKEIRTLVWWNLQDQAKNPIEDEEKIAMYDEQFDTLARDIMSPSSGKGIYELLYSIIDQHLWTPKSSTLIDADESINIVFIPMTSTLLGYVNAGTLFDRQTSSERAGLHIYMNTIFIDRIIRASASDKAYYTFLLYQTLLHELQHISTFNQKTFKNHNSSSRYPHRWLNELISISTEFLLAIPIAKLILSSRAEATEEDIYHLVERYYKKSGIFSELATQEQIALIPVTSVNGRHYRAWRLLANYLLQRFPVDYLKSVITNTKYGSDSLITASKSFAYAVDTIDELFHEYGISRISPTDFTTEGQYQSAVGSDESFSGYYITRPQSVYSSLSHGTSLSSNSYYCSGEEEVSERKLIKFFPRVLDTSSKNVYTYLTPVLHNQLNCRIAVFTNDKEYLQYFTPLWSTVVDKSTVSPRFGFLGETAFTFEALTDPDFELTIQPGSSGIISLGGYVGFDEYQAPVHLTRYFNKENNTLIVVVPKNLTMSLVVHYYGDS